VETAKIAMKVNTMMVHNMMMDSGHQVTIPMEYVNVTVLKLKKDSSTVLNNSVMMLGIKLKVLVMKLPIIILMN